MDDDAPETRRTSQDIANQAAEIITDLNTLEVTLVRLLQGRPHDSVDDFMSGLRQGLNPASEMILHRVSSEYARGCMLGRRVYAKLDKLAFRRERRDTEND